MAVATWTQFLNGTGLWPTTINVAPGNAPARLALTANAAGTQVSGTQAAIGARETNVLLTLDCTPLAVGGTTVQAATAFVSNAPATWNAPLARVYGNTVALLVGAGDAVAGTVYTPTLSIVLSNGETVEQVLPALVGVA